MSLSLFKKPSHTKFIFVSLTILSLSAIVLATASTIAKPDALKFSELARVGPSNISTNTEEFTIQDIPAGYEIDGQEIQIEEGDEMPVVAEATEIKDPKCATNILTCKPAYLQALEESKQRKIIVLSLQAQKMAALENGEAKITSNITTGKRGFNTPPGQYEIKNKLQNVALKAPKQFRAKGINYNLKVKKWMGIGNGFGFHDAYWRRTFGGKDYIRNGSHGCINTPLANMNKIYDWGEVGTKVIIF